MKTEILSLIICPICLIIIGLVNEYSVGDVLYGVAWGASIVHWAIWLSNRIGF